jgi:hypothetical protein
VADADCAASEAPGGPAMNKSLTEDDFRHAAAIIGCEVAAVKAVAEVESRHSGFNPDGSPVTLFEGHKFHEFTDGRFDYTHPMLSYPTWTRIHYGKNWRDEKARLEIAITLDRESALKATSWGLFQIMGFNYELAGYEELEVFVTDMHATEREHLMAFITFCKNTDLDDELREHRWTDFARRFNGKGYAKNHYHTRIASAFDRHSRNQGLA